MTFNGKTNKKKWWVSLKSLSKSVKKHIQKRKRQVDDQWSSNKAVKLDQLLFIDLIKSFIFADLTLTI